MNRSIFYNRHRFPPVPTASLYAPKRRSQESSQTHAHKHHTRCRGAGTASRSLPPRAHSCRPLSMRTRSSRARRITAAWSLMPVRAAARVSDSSSTSIVNRIEPSTTRIGPIFTIRRCADQNLSTLTHCSQQQSWTAYTRDPAAASQGHQRYWAAPPLGSARRSSRPRASSHFRDAASTNDTWVIISPAFPFVIIFSLIRAVSCSITGPHMYSG